MAKITPVPLSKTALAVPLGADLPKGMFVHYRYSLDDKSAIFLYGQAIDLPDPGYSDGGLLFVVSGKVTQTLPLSGLKVLRNSDDYEKHNFLALSITRACSGGMPIYFAAFGYMGDMTSPDLLMSIVPADGRYSVSALPLVDGGTFDISKRDPLRIRTWNNLFEGGCNACATHYEISEFTLIDGRPQRTKRYRTRKLYSSDDAIFDDRLRVRLVR